MPRLRMLLFAALLCLTVGALDHAVTTAATTGGTISLGTVTGNTVQVNASAAPDPWTGYEIHVGTAVSAGATLTSITGANGTALVAGANPVFCASASPAAGEKIFGCTGLDGQSVTAAGLLATFTFNATGNGCIVVRLISVPGDDYLDTYTVEDYTYAQTNTVSTATANVLIGIGTGTVADCVTTEPPSWDVSSGSLTVHVGDEAVVYLSAADPNALDIVTIERTGELPVGMSCTYYAGNPATGECHWVPTEGQLGTYLLSFVAQDNGGLQSDVHVVTINVLPRLPTYLAISDSYGTGCSIASNPNGDAICQKAVTNYPMFLRAYWEQDAYPNLQLIELTRWGQTAPFFAAAGGRSEIETALRRKPKVVTITLGANDFGFADIPYWLLSADNDTASEQIQHVQERADQLRIHLRSILSLIQAQSPDSLVFITGYPTPPTAGKCGYLRGFWGMLEYNVKGSDGLIDAIQAAASEFSNVRFVDLNTKEFDQHTMASKSSWYFGTNCGGSTAQGTIPGLVSCWFKNTPCDPHPNQGGAKAIADAVRSSAGGLLH